MRLQAAKAVWNQPARRASYSLPSGTLTAKVQPEETYRLGWRY